MKKTYTYTLIALFSLFGFIRCNSFLELEVIGKNDTNAFFAELDGLRAALPGAYNLTYAFYDTEFLEHGDVAGNMVRMSNTAGEALLFQYNFVSDPTQETSTVGYLWKKGFVVLSNVNNILEYAPELKASYPHNVTEIDNIRAQAYFLRALMHFNLVLCYAQPWGFTPDASHWGIPVLTRNPSANTPVLRSTVKQTYDRIIDDLEAALRTFSADYAFKPHYASPVACKALLARVYLHMKQWEKAAHWASEVIDQIPLTSRDKYVDMFAQNETGAEAIFRLSAYAVGKRTAKFYEYGSAVAFPADTLYTLFAGDTTDIRQNLLYYRPERKTGKVTMKYYNRNTSDTKNGVDIFVLRASELYLIRAEAYMQQDRPEAAASDIKTLKARALGIAPADVVLNYTSKEELDRIIEIERIKELCFEGHRFFDIARQGKAIVREKKTNSSVRILSYPDYRFALPIPLVEKEANPQIQQNEGY